MSDYLVHDRAGVHLLPKKLVFMLRQKFSEVNKMCYISDEAAGHYKNKNNFINLLHHQKGFQILAERHFCAMSHGMSPCDGGGGTIKRLATYASHLRKQIYNPTEMYEWAQNKNKIPAILD